jgi:hypothetical protein
VGSRVGLGAVEERKISSSFRELNLDSSAIQPIWMGNVYRTLFGKLNGRDCFGNVAVDGRRMLNRDEILSGDQPRKSGFEIQRFGDLVWLWEKEVSETFVFELGLLRLVFREVFITFSLH